MSRKSRRRWRRLRESICLVVEGCTEESYFYFLQGRFPEIFRAKVTLKIHDAHGGSPLHILEEARRENQKGHFDHVYLVYDFDRPEAPEAQKKALKEGFEVYGARPCFERWLLAHFTTQNVREIAQKCRFFVEKVRLVVHGYRKGHCPALERALQERLEEKLARARRQIKTFDQLLSALYIEVGKVLEEKDPK